ncbi:MAG: cytochrome ubiquinol oxidase subunit I [Gammaproteobacteria bacterium]|nr:cytochrome ubiquinol oxidase subunit I [Gammaproteobacteria bacterium]
MDTLMLSRLQFAFTIAFHIIFPTLTIGLAAFIALLEALWLRTGDPIYRRECIFWGRVFALGFGMGVVSGVVLSYEVGTNWSGFAEVAGNIVGPLMMYEVLAAFFLEAGFLGVMLFGWKRVGRRLHFLATLMVMTGTFFSAFWILSANSWMHTPAGFELRDGIFHAANWLEAIFTPSFPYRLAHMLLASYITTGFVVAAVSARYLRDGSHPRTGRRGLKVAIASLAVLVPLQIVVGDLHGLVAYEHQPIKVAAIEGNWETRRGAPLLLFAWPDAAAEENRYEIGIPYGSSLLLEHSLDGEVTGLKEVPPEDRPNVPIVFFSFRIMVGAAVIMLMLAWTGVWLLARGRLENSPRYLRALVWAWPLGFVATLAGWFVNEVGRQPWVVYGYLRTADAVSNIPAGQVATSLGVFVVVYVLLMAAFLYYLVKLIRRGPDKEQASPKLDDEAPARPAFMPAADE